MHNSRPLTVYTTVGGRNAGLALRFSTIIGPEHQRQVCRNKDCRWRNRWFDWNAGCLPLIRLCVPYIFWKADVRTLDRVSISNTKSLSIAFFLTTHKNTRWASYIQRNTGAFVVTIVKQKRNNAFRYSWVTGHGQRYKNTERCTQRLFMSNFCHWKQ